AQIDHSDQWARGAGDGRAPSARPDPDGHADAGIERLRNHPTPQSERRAETHSGDRGDGVLVPRRRSPRPEGLRRIYSQTVQPRRTDRGTAALFETRAAPRTIPGGHTPIRLADRGGSARAGGSPGPTVRSLGEAATGTADRLARTLPIPGDG